MNFNGRQTYFLVGILLAAVFECAANAQQTGGITEVSTVVVQSGHVEDFEALVKQYNGILAKAGASHAITVWSSLSGSNPEYARVDNYAKWGGLDQGADPKLRDYAGEMRLINNRILAQTLTRKRAFYRVLADLSLPAPKEMPKMIEVLSVTLDPHKIDEYVAMKKEYLNLEKQAGLQMAEVMRGVFGTSQWEYVTVTALDKWSDLDAPSQLAKAVGAETLRKYNFSSTQTSRQTDVYRFRPDLSYSPKNQAE